jgi:hypothetical protein
MNECIEFHDSELGQIREEGDACVIELSPAIIHRSEGRVGFDSGTIFLQKFEIVIGKAVIKKRPTEFPVLIMDGVLKVGGLVLSNIVPIKMKEEQTVLIKLVTNDLDAGLVVEGSSIQIYPCGEERFLENFPGNLN